MKKKKHESKSVIRLPNLKTSTATTTSQTENDNNEYASFTLRTENEH